MIIIVMILLTTGAGRKLLPDWFGVYASVCIHLPTLNCWGERHVKRPPPPSCWTAGPGLPGPLGDGQLQVAQVQPIALTWARQLWQPSRTFTFVIVVRCSKHSAWLFSAAAFNLVGSGSFCHLESLTASFGGFKVTVCPSLCKGWLRHQPLIAQTPWHEVPQAEPFVAMLWARRSASLLGEPTVRIMRISH